MRSVIRAPSPLYLESGHLVGATGMSREGPIEDIGFLPVRSLHSFTIDPPYPAAMSHDGIALVVIIDDDDFRTFLAGGWGSSC